MYSGTEAVPAPNMEDRSNSIQKSLPPNRQFCREATHRASVAVSIETGGIYLKHIQRILQANVPLVPSQGFSNWLILSPCVQESSFQFKEVTKLIEDLNRERSVIC